MSHLVSNPEDYFSQFVQERSNLLKELEQTARKEEIPIVGPVMGQLLYILARATKATRILELGTATGYSTLFLGRACSESQGNVITLESNPELAQRARENFYRAGMDQYIQLINQDGLRAMEDIPQGSIDMVFMDIDKIYYEPALEKIKAVLRQGGMLIVDNTAFKEVEAFNRKIHADPEILQVQLYSFLPLHSPQWDGICAALRL